ncbi:hypothetical protein AB0M97_29250 [Streptomyces sp. NPDC051207]|uniref:hypothetical protein n=1 Tax=Streptomyces sp. NPDC051207 TaxID=3154641 RepID=UPI003433CE97
MTDIPGEAPGQQAAAGIRASHGAIAAGGDVAGSSTQYITAGQAFVLPPEAYRPIPDDAADGGISNIASGLFVGRNDELTALKQAFTRPGKVVCTRCTDWAGSASRPWPRGVCVQAPAACW